MEEMKIVFKRQHGAWIKGIVTAGRSKEMKGRDYRLAFGENRKEQSSSGGEKNMCGGAFLCGAWK